MQQSTREDGRKQRLKRERQQAKKGRDWERVLNVVCLAGILCQSVLRRLQICKKERSRIAVSEGLLIACISALKTCRHIAMP